MKRHLITAVLAVVLVCVGAFRVFTRRHSHGVFVGIVTTQCGNQNFEVTPLRLRLRIREDGSLFIFKEQVSKGQMAQLLADISKTRNEKLLLFDAPDSISYQHALGVIDTAESSGGWGVLLMTPSTREACRRDEELIRPAAASPLQLEMRLGNVGFPQPVAAPPWTARASAGSIR